MRSWAWPSALLATCAAAVVLCCLPAAATAADIECQPGADEDVFVHAGVGAENHWSLNRTADTVTITAAASDADVFSLPSCTYIRCELSATARSVTCRDGLTHAIGVVALYLGDQADTAVGDFTNSIVSGGPGDDAVIATSPGGSFVEGCFASAGCGADTVRGFSSYTLGTVPDPGDDIELSGQGTISAEYRWSAVTLDLGRNGFTQGAAGENDRIVGAANIIGSYADDTLTGDAGANLIGGMPGNDYIDGREGDDTLYGDGGESESLPYGGSPGNDVIVGGPGVDGVRAGPGDDWVDLRDGETDGRRDPCGDGTDRLTADGIDIPTTSRWRSCESTELSAPFPSAAPQGPDAGTGQLGGAQNGGPPGPSGGDGSNSAELSNGSRFTVARRRGLRKRTLLQRGLDLSGTARSGQVIAIRLVGTRHNARRLLVVKRTQAIGGRWRTRLRLGPRARAFVRHARGPVILSVSASVSSGGRDALVVIAT